MNPGAEGGLTTPHAREQLQGLESNVNGSTFQVSFIGRKTPPGGTL